MFALSRNLEVFRKLTGVDHIALGPQNTDEDSCRTLRAANGLSDLDNMIINSDRKQTCSSTMIIVE